MTLRKPPFSPQRKATPHKASFPPSVPEPDRIVQPIPERTEPRRTADTFLRTEQAPGEGSMVETPTIHAFPARRFLVGDSPISEAFTTTWAQLHAHNDYHLAGKQMLREIAALDVEQSVQMLSGRTLTRLADIELPAADRHP